MESLSEEKAQWEKILKKVLNNKNVNPISSSGGKNHKIKALGQKSLEKKSYPWKA